MNAYDKKGFPVDQIRGFLEPGPIVLVSSAWSGKTHRKKGTLPFTRQNAGK
jgi:hypothetical protein